jgi:tetratricopeptide (TPR) repeat protein
MFYEQALTLRERLAGEAPDSLDFRFKLATNFNGLGRAYRSEGRETEAMAAHQKAQALCEKLARERPEVDPYRRELARALLGEAAIHYESGKITSAGEMHALALPLLEELARKEPAAPNDQYTLAYALDGLAAVHGNLGRPHQRQPVCERARSLYEQLVREHPDVPEYRVGLARIGVQLAETFAQLGDHVRAAAATEEAIVLGRREGVALYNGACAYCSCIAAAKSDAQRPSAERKELVERYARRAVALLRAADAEGQVFNTPHRVHLLEIDASLNALRQRDDFKKLLSELKDRSQGK